MVNRVMRPIRSKTFVAEETTPLLARNVSKLDVREFHSFLKTKRSDVVFYFKPETSVAG